MIAWIVEILNYVSCITFRKVPSIARKMSSKPGDVESGPSVNEQQPLPSQATEGVARGEVILRLGDREIEELWKFTYENQPLPSRDAADEVDRWKLLKLAAKFWEEEVTEITARLDRNQEEVAAILNESFQILGFYSVFQGLLVGAASQSEKLTCSHRNPLSVLSAIITVYALVAFSLKFRKYHFRRLYAVGQQQKRNQRKAQIKRLRRENLRFEFVTPTPRQELTSNLAIWVWTIICLFFAFSGALVGCINWILC